jgi:hypothetical protein
VVIKQDFILVLLPPFFLFVFMVLCQMLG